MIADDAWIEEIDHKAVIEVNQVKKGHIDISMCPFINKEYKGDCL